LFASMMARRGAMCWGVILGTNPASAASRAAMHSGNCFGAGALWRSAWETL